MERVRNTHNGYLASCGLTVPRLDNIHRTVEFATEMQRIISRYNAETGGNLQLRAGIDTGPVTSGLIGRAGLVYDLWGAAVRLASTIRRGISQPGIYVSQDVYEATPGHPPLRPGRADHRGRPRGADLAAGRFGPRMNILTEPWFYWSVIIAVALPAALVLLTEVQQSLTRRGSFMARPIGLLRNFIVPLGRYCCCWSRPPKSRSRRPRCGSSPPFSGSSFW